MKATSRFLLAFAALVMIGAYVLIATARVDAAGGVAGTLRGNVVDQETAHPIAGAKVTAVSISGTYQTTTDAKGFFVLLQVPTDTYTLTVTKDGYLIQSITGVTVLGDQSQSVGVVKLEPSVKQIGVVHATAHSAASAFQPSQTVDETTFAGKRVDQALGEKGSTDYNQLVLSAPGVIKTAAGSTNPISIRGSATVEIGYQFDGVDFQGNFFDENPLGHTTSQGGTTQGYLNGIGGGHGALQVVSGAGDATQGGIGAGVVNIVPGRGSYPGDGFLSFDMGSPYYDHAFNFQYGIATRDGRFSDFFSSRSDRVAPQYAPYGRNSADIGGSPTSAYLGTSFTYDDDVLNNFYYRFGNNGNQQIQVLADWLDHRSWGEYGGLNTANFYPYDPYSYGQFATDGNGAPMWACGPICGGSASDGSLGLAWYQSVVTYVNGVPRTFKPVTQPEQIVYGPTNFLKVGYTNNLNATTTGQVFFYNWGGNVSDNITNEAQSLTIGSNFPGYNNVGGRRVGFVGELTKQASEKHTLSLIGKFENGIPYWSQFDHGNTWVGFTTGRAQDLSNYGALVPGATACVATVITPTTCTNQPRIEDWFLPANVTQPVSGSNQCIGPAADNGFSQTSPTQMGCYLYEQLYALGKCQAGTSCKLPSIPAAGYTYAGTDFQQFGIGFRDQWVPNSKLRVDWGLRWDGQNLRWGANPFSKDLGNPSDIGLGYATLGSDYLYPRLIEPRIALNYTLNPTNVIHAGYGRSVTFYFAQTAGTPTGLQYVDPVLYQIAAKDAGAINVANLTSPSFNFGPACGSGWHGPGTNGNGTYLQNPYVSFSGGGVLNTSGWYFKCPNYAASMAWLFDQTFAAPDTGGGFPPTYNNWELAWGHQFSNGWGSKLTGYWRRGYNTYQTTFLNAGPPDPVTGQPSVGSFQVKETGIQKAFGIEFLLTTPTPPWGWSGFLSMNYINELTNTPPVSGSDSVITPVNQFLYQTGTLFHQSYLPPFSITSGIQYQTKTGWQFNPIFTADSGEPFGVGQDAIGFVNGVLYHLPTGNLGVATPYAGPGGPNQSFNATCYVDPAFPGSYFKPKDFACRGFQEPKYAGQAYTRPRLYTDLNVQFTHKITTLGFYVTNLWDNYRGEPSINQAWVPVTNGVGGVQTGQFANAYPILQSGAPNPLYYRGARNASFYDQYWLPFQEAYVPGRTWRFYAQFKI
jgi:hypothetical protein